MKIGFVGCGMVGATAAYSFVLNGVGSEIVLVDVNPDFAAAIPDSLVTGPAYSRATVADSPVSVTATAAVS